MKLILVAGLKGGVGKTTVSTGLAKAMARMGLKVGVLDLDYRTPNVLEAFGASTEITHDYETNTLNPPLVDGVKLFSMSYIWPPGKSVQVSDEDAMKDVEHLLTTKVLNWGDLDYLVVDTPPTSVGVVEAAVDAPDLAGALIVSHASIFARADTMRTIDLFREKEVPILGLICNQVGIHDLTAEDMKAVADAVSLPYFFAIPQIPATDQTAFEAKFDQIAAILGDIEPVTLTVESLEDDAWNQLKLVANLLSN